VVIAPYLEAPSRLETLEIQGALDGRETRSLRIAYSIAVISRSVLSAYMRLRHLAVRQPGQGMVEYALILVLVSIVVIIILITMGKQIRNVFSNVVAALG
jgi:pilus assembly protein Flp/PilA